MARRVVSPPSVFEILEQPASRPTEMPPRRLRQLRAAAKVAKRVPGYLTVSQALAGAKRRAA